MSIVAMRLWRRPTVLINAALAVLAVAGGFWAYQIVNGPSSASAASTTSRTRVVAVTQGDVSQTVSATATVASAATAAANFVTSGTVTEIDVHVGDVVTKGQLLAKVDPTAAQSTLSTAKANLNAANAAYSRDEADDADSATLASAQAQVTSANADVTTAQQAVDGTVLAAPMAGTVTAISGAVGSTSSGGSSSSSGSSGGSTGGGGGAASSTTSSTSSSSTSSGFVSLADLTKMQVNGSFAEADATKLKVGQVANVSWSALTTARATGKVATIAPTATTANNVNSYAVVITLDTLPDGIRIGQSTTAVVTVNDSPDAIRIPTTALHTAGGLRTVTVRVNNVDTAKQVEVGITGNSYVEITSGLRVGDQVVITTTTSSSTANTTNTNRFGTGGAGGFTGGGGAGGFTGGGGAGARGGN